MINTFLDVAMLYGAFKLADCLFGLAWECMDWALGEFGELCENLVNRIKAGR